MRNVNKNAKQSIEITSTTCSGFEFHLYKTILDTSIDGFWMVDINGNILDVNDSYCQLSGYSREELLKMNIANVEVKESPSEIKKHINFVNKVGSDCFTTKHRCKNGKIIELEVSANTIEHDKISSFAFLRDITEKKRTEGALIASEERFRSTIDNMLEGCQIIGRDWKYIYLNSTAITQSRKTKNQLLGHTMMEVYPGIESTHIFEVLQDCMEHFKSCQIENEFIFPDGSQGWFILSIQPVPEGLFILSLDITERVKSQKALQEAKRDWENIFQAIGQPSFILDPKRNIIAANRATVKMTGKTEKELLGKKCYQVLHRKNNYPEACPFEKILSSGNLETGEMEVEALEGTYLISCTPVFNNNGKLEKVIHIATDITERKEAEKKVQEYQKQLKKMASEIILAQEHERHRIAAGIHDDVGQRLAIIKFGLDSLQASETRSDILVSLRRQSKLISNAIEDVRSFTFMLSNPILYEIGLEAAIESWLKENIKNECNIKYELDSTGPKINISEEKRIILFHGVRELLTNVVKHAKADYIKVSIIRNTDYIRITVEDNGIGFEYNKDDLSQEGKVGFGLFNLHEKLEFWGGKLEFHKQSSHGTIAEIYIPIEDKKEKGTLTL